NQHAHSRRRRPREGGDHFIAFNRRSTLPRKPSSIPAQPAGSRRQSRSRPPSRPNRPGFPPPPERNRTPQDRRRQPRLTETGAASRRAGCDEARGATRSHSSLPPVPGSPRQSPPSPHRSSVAAAAFPSEPPPDENCAHQLANYLAHHSPCFDQPRQQDHPIAVARRKVGVRLRLRSWAGSISTTATAATSSRVGR